MKKGTRRTGPSNGDGNNSPKPESNRGPGTLTRRINKLREKLKPTDIQRAEQLLKTENLRVIQLAWYMGSQQKAAAKRQRLIERYKRGLERLLKSSGDAEV